MFIREHSLSIQFTNYWRHDIMEQLDASPYNYTQIEISKCVETPRIPSFLK